LRPKFVSARPGNISPMIPGVEAQIGPRGFGTSNVAIRVFAIERDARVIHRNRHATATNRDHALVGLQTRRLP
jgi:hypothetical protein